MEQHTFSLKKKYYYKHQIYYGEDGWYYSSVDCAPGGARILKTASPPSSDCSDKESPSDKSNKSKKKVRVENDTTSPPSVSTNKLNKRTNKSNERVKFKKKIRVENENDNTRPNEIALNEDKEKVRAEDQNNVLNCLIRELSTDSIRTYELYLIIINAEERKENSHLILESYYFLGEELEKRLNHYKRFKGELNAQLMVSNEVRDQLPKEIKDETIRKKTEIARKIYNFFVRLSNDKAQRIAYVQRIKTFTANSISNLSSDEIKFIVSHVKNNSR